MKLRFLRGCCMFCLLGLFAGGCASTDSNRTKTEATNGVYTITKASPKAKAQLDAVLEATEMAPVKLEPKVWADLTVLEAVPHGARVKKGDALVKLDLDKLKEQISDMEQDQPATTLGLEIATAELANLEQTTPQRLDAAKRAQRTTKEDLDYFEKTGRAAKEKASRYSVKYAEQRLESAQEELKQLDKMYKADDVTEDTEEIILKRSKNAVETAEYGLETARLGSNYNVSTTIPREYEVFKTLKRDTELTLTLTEQTAPKSLAKKRWEVEKLKRDQKKAEKRLTDLKKDLEAFAVRSPIDGLVYYGACEIGKWTTGPAVAKKLVPGGKLTPNEIFMTVVNPDKLFLKGVVQEADLAQYKPGLEGKASPVSGPDKKLPVRLEEIGSVPLPAGGFEAKISLQKSDPRLMPGMNCKVSFLEAPKVTGLMAPKEAVFGEGNDRYVYVSTEDKPEKRSVKVGQTEGKMVEVVEGLSEGDKILLQKPEAK